MSALGTVHTLTISISEDIVDDVSRYEQCRRYSQRLALDNLQVSNYIMIDGYIIGIFIYSVYRSVVCSVSVCGFFNKRGFLILFCEQNANNMENVYFRTRQFA